MKKVKHIQEFQKIIDKLWDSHQDLLYKEIPLIHRTLISPEILVLGRAEEESEPSDTKKTDTYYWRHKIRFPLHALALSNSDDVDYIVDIAMKIPRSEFKDHFSPKNDLKNLNRSIKVTNKLGAARYFHSGLPLHVAAFAGNVKVCRLLIAKTKNVDYKCLAKTGTDRTSYQYWSIRDCAYASGNIKVRELIEKK